MSDKVPKFINLFAPMTFDQELERFRNSDGRHAFDFRMKASTPDAMVRSLATYMAEGVPMSKIDGGADPDGMPFDSYIDCMKYTLPRAPKGKLAARMGVRPGDVPNHPAGHKGFFQNIYTDLLVEQTFAKPPIFRSQLQGEPGHPARRPTTLNILFTAMNGIYVKIEHGYIIDHSPALREQLTRYFNVNSDRFPSKDYNTNVSRLSMVELFGSINDQNGIFYDIVAPFANDLSKASNRFKNPLIHIRGKTTSIAIGTSLAGVSDDWKSVGTITYATLYSTDPAIAMPTIGLSLVHPLEISLEGGTNQTLQINTTGLPAGVKNVYHNFEGRRLIRGEGPEGATIKVEFPNGQEGLAQVQGGFFEIPWPTGVEIPIEKYTSMKISIADQEENVTQETIQTQITPPSIVRQLGLPILKSVGNEATGGLFSATRPTLGLSAFSGRSADSAYVSCEYGKVNPQNGIGWKLPRDNYIDRYFMLGVSVGREIPTNYKRAPLDGEYKYIGAYPFGAIKCVSVAIVATLEFGLTQVGDWVPDTAPGSPAWIQNSLYELASFSFDLTPPFEQHLNPYFTARWEKQAYQTRTMPFRAQWIHNKDSSQLRYVAKWRVGHEKQTRTMRWRARWVKDSYKTNHLYFRTVFQTGLPEDRTRHMFLVMEWSKKILLERHLRYTAKWEAAKVSVNNMQLRATWTTYLADPVVVVPFYVRKAIGPNKYEHYVSFQVYGRTAEMNEHIQNGTLLFYFSNPSKFEIVKWDYNQLPYDKVFLSTMEDEVLNDREGVPEEYEFIGNYTVKGIDPRNALSLDVVGGETQLSDSKSFWVPANINDRAPEELNQFKDPDKQAFYALRLGSEFRDEHHEDSVELDLIILNEEECCFTSKASGSRCSPY